MEQQTWCGPSGVKLNADDLSTCDFGATEWEDLQAIFPSIYLDEDESAEILTLPPDQFRALWDEIAAPAREEYRRAA